MAGRRPVPRRLARGREDRPERPRHDLDRHLHSANGGNCYNCHQISKAEISYGTIGPSLYNYGKNRGITSMDSPTVQPIFEYTWAKLYNARITNACSQMPRAGHMKLLDETQLRHLMALLLDPKSPVNQ
jgi:sulfur-oxidizing protein SoxX